MSTNVRIEHLAEHHEEVPTVARWLMEQWGHLCPNVGYEEFVATMERRTAHHQIPQTFVALEDGVLIGTASLIEHDVPTRAELTPWLASVYVDPRFRKRGIGSALVRAVLQEARNLGLEKLYLITPDQVPFYRRQGWQEMEEIVYRGEAVTIMVYALR